MGKEIQTTRPEKAIAGGLAWTERMKDRERVTWVRMEGLSQVCAVPELSAHMKVSSVSTSHKDF